MKKVSYTVGVRADASPITIEHVLEETKVKRTQASSGSIKDNPGKSSSCSRNARKRSREAPLLSLNRQQTMSGSAVALRSQKNQRCSSRGMKK